MVYLVLENEDPYTQFFAPFIRRNEKHGGYMDISLL
jgi:hypothetical protein